MSVVQVASSGRKIPGTSGVCHIERSFEKQEGQEGFPGTSVFLHYSAVLSQYQGGPQKLITAWGWQTFLRDLGLPSPPPPKRVISSKLGMF